ncbi:MAG TPA: 2-amino-4-hydroxy-6-hydroxymethyldihydropteridine diphosphokinase [Bacillota bacterium]|jgi:2-amino-4-hydroxy-6-hydroxymethyldihydropteridine diphosphokinase|nr:2-amino-4-hydroxy-6-hydroxymethyldihydropteridine diphosphokinase [Bacillota bacterium]HOJ83795.1 2-amino-4-hydroxy-6-hydroxymethyldihydropteridine diphosphokinase [Bacillota bacterium]HOL14597.1 2-amino-4-hydroxy-6-hydroxymethyldihydropteridine diphosphokinase [Bacillota bacterium]HPZ10773.1 2-amino-4-hydroxy-6-hydroxymethyldihydropteridine diphosphokinase [Bacillota bacterium]HQE08939.1 2-amino-4-hydroxy-6-hydroxymethyldihydropteridine diphosphokinase [Bacillota bacterium]
MPAAFIGLGSNLGDRMGYLREALTRLEQEPVRLGKVSPLYETEPVGGPLQGPYLNACATFETALSPVSLLRRLQQIETALGRVRRERWGPRTVDLDLLVYGNVIMRTPSLELPHPRLAERDFVLQPLKDIAPELLIPGTGKTVSQLVHERPPAGGVRLYLASWYHRS